MAAIAKNNEIENVDFSAITDSEFLALADCERKIEKGLKTFYEVGQALLTIRDERLYRSEYSTFEEYCDERWGISRPRSYQLIGAAEVVCNLSTIVDKKQDEQENGKPDFPLPATESQARPLTQLEPEEQREAWQKAAEKAESEGRKVTAKDVQEAVDEKKGKPHVAQNSGNNEWYTPEKFIEAARKVMGSIDTDPASCELANETVQAACYYSAESNGLDKPWTGNVWMNPPYAKDLIPQFASTLVEKYQNGEFQQACVLVNNATETVWGQHMMLSAGAICFLRKRVKFIDTKGEPSGDPLQGQMILYFGNSVEKFATEFTSFGIVMKRI